MIKAGQPIRPTLMTDHIAVDLNGDYWYFAEGTDGKVSWTKIGNAKENPEAVKVDAEGNVTVTYNGIKYLETVTEKDADGVDVLYYIMPHFNKDGSPNGFIKAGSDGTVTAIDAPATQKLVENTAGTDFILDDPENTVTPADQNAGVIQAPEGNVTIWMYDQNGSMFDRVQGAAVPEQENDDIDILAKDTVTIYSHSSGAIGTAKDPLEIKDKLIQKNLDDDEIIQTETHVYVPDGDLYIDKNVVVDNVIWDVATGNGSVIFADKPEDPEELAHPEDLDPEYTLTVINGGTALINTNKNREKTEAGDFIYTDNEEADRAGAVLIRELTIEGSKMDEVTGEKTVSNAQFDAGSAESGKGKIRIDKVTVGTSQPVYTADGKKQLLEEGQPEGIWEAVSGDSVVI